MCNEGRLLRAKYICASGVCKASGICCLLYPDGVGDGDEVVVCEMKGKLGKPLVDTEENLSYITQPIPRATIGRGIELVATLLSFLQDFDRILSILNNLHEIYADEDGPAIVFSCESGKGRTTTGMAIAALIYCNKKVRVHFIFPQQLLFTSFLQSNYMILGSLRCLTISRECRSGL